MHRASYLIEMKRLTERKISTDIISPSPHQQLVVLRENGFEIILYLCWEWMQRGAALHSSPPLITPEFHTSLKKQSLTMVICSNPLTVHMHMARKLLEAWLRSESGGRGLNSEQINTFLAKLFPQYIFENQLCQNVAELRRRWTAQSREMAQNGKRKYDSISVSSPQQKSKISAQSNSDVLEEKIKNIYSKCKSSFGFERAKLLHRIKSKSYSQWFPLHAPWPPQAFGHLLPTYTSSIAQDVVLASSYSRHRKQVAGDQALSERNVGVCIKYCLKCGKTLNKFTHKLHTPSGFLYINCNLVANWRWHNENINDMFLNWWQFSRMNNHSCFIAF